ITWMPSFKRTAVDVKEDGNGEVEGMEKMYFLDEMNNLLEDRGSELYRYAVQYAKDAQKWSEEHGNHRVYLRPFHEMNLGYGYNWTGFLNGGPEGVAKFNRAWKNVRDIFQKHAPNVKFVLCFESSPDVETTPELAEDWNQFEEYMPDYWVNGDIIGFDVYQKKAGLSWKHIFGKAEAFLKKYSDLPAAICEASTYDGSYRVKFIDNLFKSAQKLGLDYVVWFNEKKKESGLDRNFRYDANIIEVKTVAAQPVMTVGGDEDLMDLEGGEEEPMPAPKEVAEAEPAMTSTTPNVGLKAFREAIAKYTAGDNHGFALNPKGYIQQYWTKDGIGYETEDDIYYMTEFENEAVTDSFMKALLRMRYEKKTAEQTKAISRFPTLKSLTLLPDVNEARVEVAISHFEKWLARPKKMSTKKTGRTDFDLGLGLLMENVADEYKTTAAYLPSLLEMHKILIRYYEMFEEDTKEGTRGRIDENAQETCEKILVYLRGESYLAKLYEYVNEQVQFRQGLKTHILKLREKHKDHSEYKLAAVKYLDGKHQEKVDKIAQLKKEVKSFRINSSNLKKLKNSKAGVDGEEITVLVHMGDICLIQKKPEMAREFYLLAHIPHMDEKNDYTGVNERYLNLAAEIGLARVYGEMGTLKLLDKGVVILSKIASTEDKIDSKLRLLAKYYLGGLLERYKDLPESVHKHEKGLEMLKIAYTIYEDLSTTELSYVAGKRMKGIRALLKDPEAKQTL
ncbi:hypothetical protein ACFL4F_01320, partial [Candidatus Margulisiibacteriota bacterium]